MRSQKTPRSVITEISASLTDWGKILDTHRQFAELPHVKLRSLYAVANHRKTSN